MPTPPFPHRFVKRKKWQTSGKLAPYVLAELIGVSNPTPKQLCSLTILSYAQKKSMGYMCYNMLLTNILGQNSFPQGNHFWAIDNTL